MSMIYEIPARSATSYQDVVDTLPKDAVFKIDLSKNYIDTDDITSSDISGIKLLKWIRLKGILNHCILRGESTLSAILKADPKNAIAASKGVTYIQSSSEHHSPESSELANKSQIKQIFRIDIDLKKIRHDLANFYGLTRLQQNHLKVESGTTFRQQNSEDELISEIVRFVFSSNKPFSVAEKKIHKIQNRLSKLRSHESTVIYVDDKADKGWGDFLKKILGVNCKFHSIVPSEKETVDSLFQRIKNFRLNVRDKHLLIFDLKLKSSENNLTDYRQLLSYQTIMKLRDQFDNRLMVMYLTASNDLSKFRKLLLTKKYNPHIVFTKEGADQLLSEEESFLHYEELIELLSGFLAVDKPRKIVESIQIINLIEEKEKIELAELYENLCKSISPINRFSFVERFEEIYIDTNIFLHSDPKLLLELLITERDKIIIPATVKHELVLISEDSKYKKPLEAVKAAFFNKCIDELEIKIDQNNLSKPELEIIKKGEQHSDDFADKHFERLMKSKNDSTLFLSGDGRVFHSCINVTTRRGIGCLIQQLKIEKSSPPHVAIKVQQAPRNFVIKTVNASKESWILTQGVGGSASLTIKKSDLTGWSYKDLMEKLIGKEIRTDSSVDEVKKLISDS